MTTELSSTHHRSADEEARLQYAANYPEAGLRARFAQVYDLVSGHRLRVLMACSDQVLQRLSQHPDITREREFALAIQCETKARFAASAATRCPEITWSVPTDPWRAAHQRAWIQYAGNFPDAALRERFAPVCDVVPRRTLRALLAISDQSLQELLDDPRNPQEFVLAIDCEAKARLLASLEKRQTAAAVPLRWAAAAAVPLRSAVPETGAASPRPADAPRPADTINLSLYFNLPQVAPPAVEVMNVMPPAAPVNKTISIQRDRDGRATGATIEDAATD